MWERERASYRRSRIRGEGGGGGRGQIENKEILRVIHNLMWATVGWSICGAMLKIRIYSSISSRPMRKTPTHTHTHFYILTSNSFFQKWTRLLIFCEGLAHISYFIRVDIKGISKIKKRRKNNTRQHMQNMKGEFEFDQRIVI